MAKEHQRLNKINFPSLWPLSICVVLLCLLQYHEANGMECGPDDYIDALITKRLIGGTGTNYQEWPFIAALLLTTRRGNQREKYFCGGTLVSNRHILTAAHCMQDKGAARPLFPGDIEVLLGAYNLSACDDDVVRRNVAVIKIHPDWNVNADKFDADVAILVLSENVTFTTHIGPISLPAVGVVVDPSTTIDINGTIVGWGATENSSHGSDIPRHAAIRTYNNSYCFLTDNEALRISSKNSFCAGSNEGSPNRGDSGGGFFVKIDDTWVQYGIVSSIIANEKGRVVRRMVSIYTNVNSFKNWIEETIEESGGVLGDPILDIDLRCAYRLYELQYQCHFQNLNIRSDNIAVGSVTGSHYTGKSDQQVKDLYFESGTMFSLPYGIGKIFKSLRTLRVKRELGTKQITRSKLQNLPNLEELHFEKNEIELLRFNALWDLESLRIFRLIYNKIEVLDKRTFKQNDKLMEVDLRSNRLKILPKDLFKNNPSLEIVDLGENALTTIETDFSALRLREFYLGNNRCIDAYFSDNFEPSDSERFTTLSSLQRHIRSRCQTM